MGHLKNKGDDLPSKGYTMVIYNIKIEESALLELVTEARLLDALVIQGYDNGGIEYPSTLSAFNYALRAAGIYPVTVPHGDDGETCRSKFMYDGALSPSYDGTSLDEVADWLESQMRVC